MSGTPHFKLLTRLVLLGELPVCTYTTTTTTHIIMIIIIIIIAALLIQPNLPLLIRVAAHLWIRACSCVWQLFYLSLGVIELFTAPDTNCFTAQDVMFNSCFAVQNVMFNSCFGAQNVMYNSCFGAQLPAHVASRLLTVSSYCWMSTIYEVSI